MFLQPVIFRWHISTNSSETIHKFVIKKKSNQNKFLEWINEKEHLYNSNIRILEHRNDFLSVEIEEPDTDFDGEYSLQVIFKNSKHQYSNDTATFYLHIGT